MSMIEVVVIDGLDEAIVGSALVNDREVIAYNYDKCVALIVEAGNTLEHAQEFLKEITSQEFEGAPVFIYFDEETEFYGSSVPEGRTVH
jgi:hypothetical protein